MDQSGRYWLLGIVSALISIFVFSTGIQSLPELFSAKHPLMIRSTPSDEVIGSLFIRGFGPAMGRSIYCSSEKGKSRLLFKITKPLTFMESDVSPDRKRIAILLDGWSDHNFLEVVNFDGSHRHEFKLATSSTNDAKNLVWVSRDKLRLYADKPPLLSADEFKLDNWPLKESGTFELTFDEFNSLQQVQRYK